MGDPVPNLEWIDTLYGTYNTNSEQLAIRNTWLFKEQFWGDQKVPYYQVLLFKLFWFSTIRIRNNRSFQDFLQVLKLESYHSYIIKRTFWSWIDFKVIRVVFIIIIIWLLIICKTKRNNQRYIANDEHRQFDPTLKKHQKSSQHEILFLEARRLLIKKFIDQNSINKNNSKCR